MDMITWKGRLDRYLKAPLFVIALLAAATVAAGFLISLSAAVFGAAITAIYAIITIVFYLYNRRRLSEEIVSFATQYSLVQRKLLKESTIPYALLDPQGHILWTNNALTELLGETALFEEPVTHYIDVLTPADLAAACEESISLYYERGDAIYNLTLQPFSTEELDPESEPSLLSFKDKTVLGLTLMDETEVSFLRQEQEDEQIVVCLVYIDNYEETVESIDSVRRSLLTALIDRKINKYFSSADAIVRKTERDKYFIIFRHRFLAAMEESKFSLLEDVKATKVGGSNYDVTISIGLGLGGGSYVQNAEYARTAIDLALGRGGSQAVIKDAEEVSYYGVRGKEIERSTRVKARVKALALREIMATREQILIMGHQLSDEDVLGSAIGIYVAARELGKSAHIVLDTITASLRPLADLFLNNPDYPPDMIINNETALSMVDSHTLVVVVDTNRPSYTECPGLLHRSKHVVVFDHHRQGAEVVSNPVLSYIEPYASSACEMIAEMLSYFSDKVTIRPQEADCIYAGILIDTNNFVTKTGVRTFEAAAWLRRSGADVTRVRKLLREDIGSYKARAEIVRHAMVYRDAFAVSHYLPSPTDRVESPTVVGAQAANELLNIVGIKASFVLTDYNNKIYISARSIDEIDVQAIMERLGGGGHLNVAGAQMDGKTVDEVQDLLTDVIDEMIDAGQITL